MEHLVGRNSSKIISVPSERMVAMYKIQEGTCTCVQAPTVPLERDESLFFLRTKWSYGTNRP